MFLQKIEVNNFRLLEGVELSLEEGTTVIVGSQVEATRAARVPVSSGRG